eukprot:gene17975-24380_t
MGDRPSDNFQPNTKRRAGGQATKDNFDEDDDAPAEDPGEWRPVADPEVLKRRKIVRARRAGDASGDAAPSTEAAGSAPAAASAAAPAVAANPFSGISLAPPAAAASNPFSGISLLAPAVAKKEEEPKKDEVEGKKNTLENNYNNWVADERLFHVPCQLPPALTTI